MVTVRHIGTNTLCFYMVLMLHDSGFHPFLSSIYRASEIRAAFPFLPVMCIRTAISCSFISFELPCLFVASIMKDDVTQDGR
mgnify:CR=1 FL=1